LGNRDSGSSACEDIGDKTTTKKERQRLLPFRSNSALRAGHHVRSDTGVAFEKPIPKEH
jgi:hypothetical protein